MKIKHPLGKTLAKIALLACAWAGLLLPAAPALAHHSGAMFDTTREVRIAGVIKTFKWANPHAWIEVDVPGEGGTVTTWGVEMTSPTLLAETGWTRSTLKPGDKVVLFVAPLRDGKPGGSYVGVKLADGRWLGRGQPRS
jgi:Family of unknown function (DUF6152)